MQLIYKDEQFVLKRDESAMETVLEKVSELIEEKDIVFSHLVIDGVELYENHEEYIKDRIATINHIEVITYKTKEMVWETLQSVDEYFDRAIPALNDIVDESYDQFTEETWEGISQLMDGLEWILQFKTFTESVEEQPKDWNVFEETFSACEEQFEPFLEAIETQDTVLISDLLAYEFAPAFEQMAETVRTMLEDTAYLEEEH